MGYCFQVLEELGGAGRTTELRELLVKEFSSPLLCHLECDLLPREARIIQCKMACNIHYHECKLCDGFSSNLLYLGKLRERGLLKRGQEA